ncbi:hypothetical protein [Actinoplanes sp. NPDC026619]|uniref:hypothetical protein n=1 Tax=Actinoplanes sp. NPDC026619 TaxID=3155798 RepID=UPI0033D7969D
MAADVKGPALDRPDVRSSAVPRGVGRNTRPLSRRAERPTLDPNAAGHRTMNRLGMTMSPVLIGVIGTLSGLLLGGLLQDAQARRNRRWLVADALRDTKRRVYAEYLRSISASYAHAVAHHWSDSEEANLRAAAAEIEVLAGVDVARPAQELVGKVIKVHGDIAARSSRPPSRAAVMRRRVRDDTGWESAVAAVDRERYQLIDLLKADLGLTGNRKSRGRRWLFARSGSAGSRSADQ